MTQRYTLAWAHQVPTYCFVFHNSQTRLTKDSTCNMGKNGFRKESKKNDLEKPGAEKQAHIKRKEFGDIPSSA